MKAADIVKQLQIVLPTVTDLFSDQIILIGIIPTGTTATAEVTSHNFEVGDVVTITDTFSPVSITSISREGEIATVTTATPHDITENDLTTEVTISGTSDNDFNGTFPFLSASNRLTFQFTVPDTIASGATGGLLDDPPGAFGYNGTHIITAISGTQFFDYELPIALTNAATGTGVVSSGVRVTGAVNLERAIEMYTKQTDVDSLWAFVVLNETIASNNRNSFQDGVTSASPGGDRRQQIYQNFTVYVVKNTSDDLAARAARDSMEDVMVFFFQALMFWKAPSGLADTGNMGVVFVAHQFAEYNTTVYIHEFQFQLVSNITRSDTIADDFNVAFRDISLTMGTNLGTEKLIAEIDLDDDPLP